MQKAIIRPCISAQESLHPRRKERLNSIRLCIPAPGSPRPRPRSARGKAPCDRSAPGSQYQRLLFWQDRIRHDTAAPDRAAFRE